MRFFIVVVLIGLLSSAGLPSAAAESSRTYYYGTGAEASSPAGTFALLSEPPGSGGTVSLTPVGNVWADTVGLLAPVSLTNENFEFELFFASPGGNVVVSYGYIPAGQTRDEWVVLATSESEAITAADRDSIPNVGQPLTPIGRASGAGHVTGPASVPAGSHLAIMITPTEDKTMFTDSSLLGSSTSSSASVPLPELPALVLMALGLTTVGAVSVLRTRRA